ncbi:2-Hydroxyacid oxidase 2 isoform X2 [Carettochelys insculpta]|uniref:2-Hydroxyacid oxidase 2 isoform X2 n=1 Tax=Carettochelys insculpta TaxID=44489 RepID=UPI003EBC7C02
MPMICLSDFEAYAKKRLPKTTWDFFEGGADECYTRDENLLAYKRICFRPRVLRDVSVIDTRTKLLGTEISFPVGIAPTGFHRLAWPDGEKSTARGRTLTEGMVRRAEAAGYQGLVLTVDLPYPGKRRGDFHNNFHLPPHMTVKNFEGVFEKENSFMYGLPLSSLDSSLNWNDISWLQSLTHLPIIIKGILTKEDADLAVRHRVQGIIVSNHGGRQLDGGPATIDVLSEIVDTVQERAAVYLDGGIRTGSDVLKALALGAKCVFIGRPALWGLTYKGEEGLRELLQILRDEFRLSMALTGCACHQCHAPAQAREAGGPRCHHRGLCHPGLPQLLRGSGWDSHPHLHPASQWRTIPESQGLPFCRPPGLGGQPGTFPGHLCVLAWQHPRRPGFPELGPVPPAGGGDLHPPAGDPSGGHHHALLHHRRCGIPPPALAHAPVHGPSLR